MAFPREEPGIPRRSSHHELTEDVVYAEANQRANTTMDAFLDRHPRS